MDNRLIFLYQCKPLRAMGGRRRLGAEAARPLKPVGSVHRQIRAHDDREVTRRGRFAKPNGADARLPRKASSQEYTARTANRHRWAGRIYQGERETLR
jgi:hypothetical protein